MTKTWEDFSKQFLGGEPFYTVIDPQGQWCVSAKFFATAVHWAACNLGHHYSDPEQELAFLNEAGYSVVHSSLLRPLFEAGAIQ